MKYSLLDSTGICLNTTVWDGISEWQPPEGQILVEAEFKIGARYAQDPETHNWVLVEEPPAPPSQPEWVRFGTLLANDPDVNAMVATAASTAPVLHLMLGVGLGQAAQGSPKTFSTAWSTAISAGLVSLELANHVADLGVLCHLPADFIEELRTGAA